MNTTPWNIDTAIDLAEWSQAAYMIPNTVTKGLCPIRGFAAARGFQSEIVSDKATDSLIIVASDGRRIIVSARGTRSLENWLVDCDIAFDRWSMWLPPTLKVHAGFKRAFAATWERVTEQIIIFKEADPQAEIFFNGHSLGAAIAAELWIFWQEAQGTKNPKMTASLINFGQPRMGNHALAQYAESLGASRHCTRFIHCDDPVPRVPFRAGLYRHWGTEIWFDENNQPWTNQAWYWKLPADADALWREGKMFLAGCGHLAAEKLLRRDRATMKGQVYIPLLSDHSIENYLRMLREYKRKQAIHAYVERTGGESSQS